MEIWIVTAVIAGCMILFLKESLPVEVVSLLGLIVLVVTRVLSPDQAFRSFADPALITIAAVFVLSAGLIRTGVADYLGQQIQRVAENRFFLLLILLMLTITVISAFMNNVAATAVLLPVVLGLASKSKIHPGKLLMPIAFGAMFGGTCTAIGTSTNMVMSTFLARNQMEPFRLFEFTPIGCLIAVAGILYMVTIGHRLIPERGEVSMEESYHLRDYITEVVILEGSPLIGKTVLEGQFSEKLDLTVVGLSRGKKKFFVLEPDQVLQAGDLLLMEGKVDNILKIKDTFGIEIKSDFKLTDKELQDEEIKLAEVIIGPQSKLIGKSLKDSRFRQRYDLVALALHRKGRTLRRKVSQVPFELGDVLLVQGRETDIRKLRLSPDFLLLQDLPISRFKRRKARWALLIFLGVLLLSGFQVLPIAVSALIGALFMILSRCLDSGDAYQSINWPSILLIAGMSSVGMAMEKTGLAEFLASVMVDLLGGIGPTTLLGGFFVLTVLLTQPMSNAAAALLVAPVALSTAHSLNLNPRPFIMTVALAASSSFMTPLEPACTLVYGPGKYRFIDFVKCGSILTLIVMAVTLYFVPLLWPFK